MRVVSSSSCALRTNFCKKCLIDVTVPTVFVSLKFAIPKHFLTLWTFLTNDFNWWLCNFCSHCYAPALTRRAGAASQLMQGNSDPNWSQLVSWISSQFVQTAVTVFGSLIFISCSCPRTALCDSLISATLEWPTDKILDFGYLFYNRLVTRKVEQMF